MVESGNESLSSPAVTVLGRLTASAADSSEIRLSTRAQQLLAALVAAGPEGASADKLAETLWAEKLPGRWPATFRMAVSRFRTALGAEVIAESGWYRLDLPITSVDSWRLLDLAADDDHAVTHDDLAWALAGAAFGDVDAGILVVNATIRCTAAQSIVARRYCDAASSIDDRSAALLIEHQQALAPYEEDLIRSVAACLDRAGKTAAAASYLDDVLATHLAELGAQSSDLLELRASVGDPPPFTPMPASGEPEPPLRRSNTSSRVPPMLEHVVDEPCFGREAERARLTSGRSHVLVGPLGSGKTRLLAAIAENALAAGDTVSYVSADSGHTPYGPFLAAFPTLRSDPFVGLVGGDLPAVGSDAAVLRTADTRRTLLVVDHLDAIVGDGRHWLLIDDVHGFDEASQRLVGFLAVADTRRPLTIVVAGRNDDGQETSAERIRQLRRAGFGSVSLGPLGPAEMEAMLAEALPDLTVAPRAELARALFARSGGIPAVARVLIRTIDPAMLVFDDEAETAEPDAWTNPAPDLPRDVIQVGVAAAVLGDIFAINDVMALLDRPEDEVGYALEQLWDRDIVIDGKDPSELRFANTLLRKSFLSRAPSFRLVELHSRAAELVDDLHAKADHEAAAVPKVPADQAAASLLRSASASMEDGSWRDAVDALRRATTILDREPDIATLVMLARALDLSGANGAGPRKVAFRRAVASQRWDLALAAAASGLPEAERPDGDNERIAMLEAIPADRLDDDQRFERALALARQCALVGSPDRARSWVDVAERLAVTGDTQRTVRAEIAAWSVAHHVSPEPFRFCDEVTKQATGHERTRLLEMQTITTLETGAIAEAVDLHEQFTRSASEVGDPVRIWQCRVLAATLAFDLGRWTEATELSSDAVDYGTRHAMQQAALVGLGQTFYHMNVTGQQGQLVDRFEQMPANTEASAIAIAANALALAARNRREEAWLSVAPTVLDALERPSGSALVILAMLAGLISDNGDSDVVDPVRCRLAEFSDRSLVVGYGIASTGPVHRQLALLAANRDEKIDHSVEAVRVADRSGALTWQVSTRLSLVRATGRADVEAEAVELATGTELACLLPTAPAQ